MAISGAAGAVYAVKLGEGEAFTNEPMTTEDGGTTYVINDFSIRHWDPSAPITVRVNGNAPSVPYTILHHAGIIQFSEPVIGDVTVSGYALDPEMVGGFFEWSIDLASETQECTTFGSQGWKEYIITTSEFSGSASSYFVASNYEKFPFGELVLMKLFIDVQKNHYIMGYGIVTGKSVTVPAGGIVENEVEFQGTSRVYYNL